jgi:hypothetical protein
MMQFQFNKNMTYTHRVAVILASLLNVGLAQAGTYTFTPNVPLEVSGPQGSLGSWTLIGGTGALNFSNGAGVVGETPVDAVGGLIGTINVAHIKLTPLDGAQYSETTSLIDGEAVRSNVKVGATVTSVTLDDQTGAVVAVGSFGGALEQAPRTLNLLKGGQIAFTNLRFNLVEKTVTADLSGTPLVYDAATQTYQPGVTTTVKDMVTWNITSISGPTTLPPSALAAAAAGDFGPLQSEGFELKAQPDGTQLVQASNTLYGLKVTSQGFNLVAQSLGIGPTSVAWGALAAVNDEPDGWGSVTSTISFTRTIPEPSTYVLMGLGLCGIALVARRRRV